MAIISIADSKWVDLVDIREVDCLGLVTLGLFVEQLVGCPISGRV